MQKILLFVMLSVVLFSCGNNDFADPNIVAQKFLENYVTMNYDEAKKYVSGDFTTVLETYEADKALMDESVIKEHASSVAEIKNIDIQEAEGTALVKFTNSRNPDLVDELELKKVEEKWLVIKHESKANIIADEKFTEDFIDDLEKDAAEQDEIIPVE